MLNQFVSSTFRGERRLAVTAPIVMGCGLLGIPFSTTEATISGVSNLEHPVSSFERMFEGITLLNPANS